MARGKSASPEVAAAKERKKPERRGCAPSSVPRTRLLKTTARVTVGCRPRAPGRTVHRQPNVHGRRVASNRVRHLAGRGRCRHTRTRPSTERAGFTTAFKTTRAPKSRTTKPPRSAAHVHRFHFAVLGRTVRFLLCPVTRLRRRSSSTFKVNAFGEQRQPFSTEGN